MDLSKLEKYKQKFRFFREPIGSLQAYLDKVSQSAIQIISPYQVSRVLAIPELDAVFLLALAEKEHLVQKKFLVFTKDEHSLLGEFDDKQEIPTEIENNETGKPVDQDHYYIDIVFEVPHE